MGHLFSRDRAIVDIDHVRGELQCRKCLRRWDENSDWAYTDAYSHTCVSANQLGLL